METTNHQSEQGKGINKLITALLEQMKKVGTLTSKQIAEIFDQTNRTPNQ